MAGKKGIPFVHQQCTILQLALRKLGQTARRRYSKMQHIPVKALRFAYLRAIKAGRT